MFIDDFRTRLFPYVTTLSRYFFLFSTMSVYRTRGFVTKKIVRPTRHQTFFGSSSDDSGEGWDSFHYTPVYWTGLNSPEVLFTKGVYVCSLPTLVVSTQLLHYNNQLISFPMVFRVYSRTLPPFTRLQLSSLSLMDSSLS